MEVVCGDWQSAPVPHVQPWCRGGRKQPGVCLRRGNCECASCGSRVAVGPRHAPLGDSFVHSCRGRQLQIRGVPADKPTVAGRLHVDSGWEIRHCHTMRSCSWALVGGDALAHTSRYVRQGHPARVFLHTHRRYQQHTRTETPAPAHGRQGGLLS